MKYETFSPKKYIIFNVENMYLICIGNISNIIQNQDR